MTSFERFDYWLDIAEYDLVTAEAMYNSGRWLYVAFMCQQAIEKLCKGLYNLYADENAPRIHNIRSVLRKFADKLPAAITEEQYRFFDNLTAFYLEGRYPEHKQKLSELVHEPEAKRILAKTKEEFEWPLTLKM
ncbi:MAG: HEPN domain-containing protein [Oscillospiraceae bacterium]|nr:HEPN domain-containing protein [Oscillospiraceae bacterium]